MKKILFAVMLCCVAMTSALLSSCEQPSKPFDETILLGVLDPYLVWGCSADDVQKHIEANLECIKELKENRANAERES